jgi:lysozyme family protein
MMSSEERFNQAIPIIINHEGGLVNNPDDPGGITNFGITILTLSAYYRIKLIDKQASADDIRNLTKEQAEDVYKVLWWDMYKYNEINDITLATKVFDMSVNMGNYRAHEMLQQAINELMSGPAKLTVDGILGSKTFACANMLPTEELHQKLRDLSVQYYKDIVAYKPHLEVFLKGWLARAAY